MIQIIDKKKCCGCTACYSVCPKSAIIMHEDDEGFLYPDVDREKCVDCGLCDAVCPVFNAPKRKDNNVESYVLRAKKLETVNQSTSGGFITPLVEYVLHKNGVVCAATYDNEFKVEHQFLTCGGYFYITHQRFQVCTK